MADEILFLGNYGVKLSDLIAAAALAVATYSAWLSWANDRRDRRREEARTGPCVRVSIVNDDDDEGRGPERRLKLMFSPPENGDYCELNACELLTPEGTVEVIKGDHKFSGGPRVELKPPVPLVSGAQHLKVILHLVGFAGPTVLKFEGVGYDTRRSPVEVKVTVPPRGQAHG